MATKSKLYAACVGLFAILLVAPAYGWNANKDIDIESGAQSEGRSTVNGGITVGSNALISGSLETVNGPIRIDDSVQLTDAATVNGSIRIGDGLIAEDLESVNGTIRIGRNAAISGGVSVVNGKIRLGAGSSVAEDVSNVNGELRIAGSEIGGNLSTVTGDVWLTDNSVLRGDLIIEKPGGWRNRWGRRKPKIVIGPESRVLGTIEAEHEIELFISDSAEVAAVIGESSLDQAVRFSGDTP